MIRLQDLFFEELEQIAGAHELRVVQQASFANCGTISLLDDELTSVLSFKYSFNEGHNVFESGRAIFTGSNPNMDIVKKAGDLRRVLDLIDGAVEGILHNPEETA